MNINLNKISIVGCGRVGMSAAYSLLHTGDVNELVLFGRCKENLVGEMLDLEHGISFLKPAKVYPSTDIADIAGSDIVIYTAGAAQKPGETRLDLVEKNSKILEEYLPDIVKYAPQAVIVIVSNPVDILTYKAYKMSGLPKGRILGTGTTLDTARFRYHLSEYCDINPQSIHAYLLGEHGDSSFPAISSANIGGQALTSLTCLTEDKVEKAYYKAKHAAYKVIAAKGATYYAIASVLTHIVTTILSDAKKVLPVSVPLHNYYDISGVALSVPCIIGRNGVERVLKIKLSWEEKQKLEKSAKTLKKFL